MLHFLSLCRIYNEALLFLPYEVATIVFFLQAWNQAMKVFVTGATGLVGA